MLLPATEPLADPPDYDKRPLDPELVRVIRTGQTRDLAGMSAMQRLVPCILPPGEKQRRHLLPLPSTLSAASPELFGLFAYEFALGHDRGAPNDPLWVTAQGRFGQPLVLEGVQHPAPALSIDVTRDKVGTRRSVASIFTQAIHEEQVLSAAPPSTELWFVLYARVLQVDGVSRRNLQIGLRWATPKRRARSVASVPTVTLGRADWDDEEIRAALETWGLPEDVPLGFLAIEFLPEPNGRFADPPCADLRQVRILRPRAWRTAATAAPERAGGGRLQVHGGAPGRLRRTRFAALSSSEAPMRSSTVDLRVRAKCNLERFAAWFAK